RKQVSSMDEEELEKLKEEKMDEIEGGEAEEAKKQQEEKIRKQLKQIASQILTEEARSRLGNIRMAKPDLASAIEYQLVQLHRAGRINGKIGDEELKRLLKQVQESKDEQDIKYTTPR
ncbi:MAG: DNA-binding protein, partial [Candidatus Nanohaloarchaea archaeon]|nr:DNA-binding protein [Candidatus Nanohaloarchaea archaeon]